MNVTRASGPRLRSWAKMFLLNSAKSTVATLNAALNRARICTQQNQSIGFTRAYNIQRIRFSEFARSVSSAATQKSEKGKEEQSTDTVQITYIDRDGERHVISGKVGDNVMYLAHRHDLDIEGACEASLACCTCHVYVKDEFYDMLGEPTEEEEDMLDLAPFLQENSRLSCQIILSKEIDGIEVTLPSATRNFYVDGHKPKPH